MDNAREEVTELTFGRSALKTDARVEACGVVDELGAFLGLARAELGSGDAELLQSVQRNLVVIGAELATAPCDAHRLPKRLGEDHLARLDDEIERLSAEPPTVSGGFALAGGTRESALLDVCRTVARRAERRAWRVKEAGLLANALVPTYLNRLSNLLWLLARRSA